MSNGLKKLKKIASGCLIVRLLLISLAHPYLKVAGIEDLVLNGFFVG